MENNIVDDRVLNFQSEVKQALERDQLFKFSLTELYIPFSLQNNHFSSLSNNSTLTRLTLHLNEEGDIKPGYYIEGLLIKHPTLKTLNLRNDSTSFDLENSLHFSEGLRMNTTLTDLTMNWECDEIEPISIFIEAFKYNTTLKKLTMEYSMPDAATILLCNSLMHNTSLTSLNITFAKFDGPSLQKLMELNQTIKELDLTLQFHSGMKTVFNHILQTNQSLKSLTLRVGGSGIDANDLYGLKENQSLTTLHLAMRITGNFNKLTEALQEAKSLKELRYERISDDQVDALAEYIKQTMILKIIKFRLDVRDDSWSILSNAIAINKSITSISVSPIKFVFNREYLWIETLMKSSTLTDLTLKRCKFDDQKIDILEKALSTNKSLLKLDISLLTSDTANLKCFKSLQQNDTLKILSTRGYRIESSSCVELVKLVETNTTLEELNINTDILKENLQHMCTALKSNKSLRTLTLYSRVYGKENEFVNIMKDMLSVNTTLTELRIGEEKVDYAIKPALEANKKRFEELKKSFIVLLHNIVRDKETRLTLPLELWQQIFVQLKYSGINFGATVKRIFNE